jgi:PAS domain S-box-containing protein
VRRAGSALPVEYNATPILRGTQILGAVISFNDTTARRAAAEKLRSREEQFRKLLDATPDAMVVSDGEGRITMINHQAEVLLGYTRGELLGRSVDILVPERFRAGHPALREGYVRNPDRRGMGSGRALWALTKDGREVPIETSLSPIETDEGVMVISALRDITQRKEAEKALADERERLSAAMAGANLGLWDWQADPDVLTTNDLWSEMLGYRREELDAMYGNTAARWANMVYPDDLDAAVSYFTRFVNNEIHEYRMELRMKTKSGKPKWVLSAGDAVGRDGTGKVTRMVGIHQDITERKQWEAQDRLIAGVRDAIWRLDESSTEHDLTAVMHRALTEARVPVWACCINLVDAAVDPPGVTIHGYSVNDGPTVRALEPQHAPLVVDFWKNSEVAYRPDLRQEDSLGERKSFPWQ